MARMGPIIIPNCVEVRLHWLFNTIPYFNVLHAQYTLAGPLNPTVGESIFASLKAAAATTTWLGQCTPPTVLSGLGVRDLRAANNPELLSTGAAAPGTNGGAALPPQVAMVVTLRTNNAGRQFRGRVYLGGMAQGVSTGSGTILGASNTQAVAFVTAIQSALATQSMTLAIGQKHLPPRPAKDGSTLPDRPANVIPVTQILTLNTRFDTQRRRLQ